MGCDKTCTFNGELLWSIMGYYVPFETSFGAETFATNIAFVTLCFKVDFLVSFESQWTAERFAAFFTDVRSVSAVNMHMRI